MQQECEGEFLAGPFQPPPIELGKEWSPISQMVNWWRKGSRAQMAISEEDSLFQPLLDTFFDTLWRLGNPSKSRTGSNLQQEPGSSRASVSRAKLGAFSFSFCKSLGSIIHTLLCSPYPKVFPQSLYFHYHHLPFPSKHQAQNLLQAGVASQGLYLWGINSSRVGAFLKAGPTMVEVRKCCPKISGSPDFPNCAYPLSPWPSSVPLVSDVPTGPGVGGFLPLGREL